MSWNCVQFVNLSRQTGHATRQLETLALGDQLTDPKPDDDTASSMPGSFAWRGHSSPTRSFFAHDTSGAQRLPNGNPLIADGPHGVIIEITLTGEKVWEYVNPTSTGVRRSSSRTRKRCSSGDASFAQDGTRPTTRESLHSPRDQGERRCNDRPNRHHEENDVHLQIAAIAGRALGTPRRTAFRA
jgi:hypothetical protein